VVARVERGRGNPVPTAPPPCPPQRGGSTQALVLLVPSPGGDSPAVRPDSGVRWLRSPWGSGRLWPPTRSVGGARRRSVLRLYHTRRTVSTHLARDGGCSLRCLPSANGGTPERGAHRGTDCKSRLSRECAIMPLRSRGKALCKRLIPSLGGCADDHQGSVCVRC
jgi:hypothetical protein